MGPIVEGQNGHVPDYPAEVVIRAGFWIRTSSWILGTPPHVKLDVEVLRTPLGSCSRDEF